MARKSKAVASVEWWAVRAWERAGGEPTFYSFEAWRAVKYELWGTAEVLRDIGEMAAADLAEFLAFIAERRSTMVPTK